MVLRYVFQNLSTIIGSIVPPPLQNTEEILTMAN